MKILDLEIANVDAQTSLILDVGCGQGWVVLDAARQGGCAYGLDLSAELLSRARKHATEALLQKLPIFVLGTSDRVPFPSDSFDLVVCTELIEHTFETESTLLEISRVLKPGGLCILSFPVKYVENIIARISPSFLAYSGHVKQFTLGEMDRCLAQCHLRILHIHRKYFEWTMNLLFRALIHQIPAHDRRHDQYGIEAAQDLRWQTLDYYYKRLWAKAVQWKIGVPVLWLGNQILPKSYALVCKKTDR